MDENVNVIDVVLVVSYLIGPGRHADSFGAACVRPGRSKGVIPVNTQSYGLDAVCPSKKNCL